MKAFWIWKQRKHPLGTPILAVLVLQMMGDAAFGEVNREDYTYQVERCKVSPEVTCEASRIPRSISSFIEGLDIDPEIFLRWNEFPPDTDLDQMLEPFRFYMTSDRSFRSRVTYQVPECKNEVESGVSCKASTEPTTIGETRGHIPLEDFIRWNDLPPDTKDSDPVPALRFYIFNPGDE